MHVAAGADEASAVETVRFLLDNGADPNLHTPLLCNGAQAANNVSPLAVVRFLGAENLAIALACENEIPHFTARENGAQTAPPSPPAFYLCFAHFLA